MHINLYFREEPSKDRWIRGDRHLRKLIRYLIRRKKVGGVEKVFLNLCTSLELLKVDFSINKPFSKIGKDDAVVVLGSGRYSLKGYSQPNKVIAGIGLMTHPSEWPDLIKDYPVKKYLQHCDWASNVYKSYYGDEVCMNWPAGIDTIKWKSDIKTKRNILIYDKVRWNHHEYERILKQPIIKLIQEKGYHVEEIVYGNYFEIEYFEKLSKAKAMIFLCEHESQGFACCEAMSMDVPVLAWNQGYCLDPNRFNWDDPEIPATSVPFFDERCGMKFIDLSDFNVKIVEFLNLLEADHFKPRNYILENLTLEKSGSKMLQIIKEVYE